MVRYPSFIIFNVYYPCGVGLVCWNADISGFLHSLENFIDLLCFLVLALESSAFGRLLEEGIFNAVKKPLRLSDPCFAVFSPNVGFKPVFKPVALNLESSSSFTSYSSVSVDYFCLLQNSFHLTTFLNLLIAMSMSA